MSGCQNTQKITASAVNTTLRSDLCGSDLDTVRLSVAELVLELSLHFLNFLCIFPIHTLL